MLSELDGPREELTSAVVHDAASMKHDASEQSDSFTPPLTISPWRLGHAVQGQDEDMPGSFSPGTPLPKAKKRKITHHKSQPPAKPRSSRRVKVETEYIPRLSHSRNTSRKSVDVANWPPTSGTSVKVSPVVSRLEKCDRCIAQLCL
jgi:hypothetical protein